MSDTPTPLTDQQLRDQVAEALMSWAESNNTPGHAPFRRPETVTRNAYSRADAVLAVVQPELDRYRALALGDPDGRISASCDTAEHPTWLRRPDDTRGCPWCEADRLRAEQAQHRDQVLTEAAEMLLLDAGLREAEGLVDAPREWRDAAGFLLAARNRP